MRHATLTNSSVTDINSDVRRVVAKSGRVLVEEKSGRNMADVQDTDV